MRGKVHTYTEMTDKQGITPAYAGKSIFEFCIRGFDRDHPRLCGEKSEPENCDMNNQGSPPPMRGKALAPIVHTSSRRITPAYAGKSLFLNRQFYS